MVGRSAAFDGHRHDPAGRVQHPHMRVSFEDG
jgi:hypothetical protein